MKNTNDIPLFPLNIVLFPGGRFDLQIFERRYIDLVSHCMRTGTGFGICLLKSGDETNGNNLNQTVYNTGTYAKIVDWDQLESGLLGITVEGAVKFVAQDFWKEEDDVLHASVEFSDIESTEADVIPLGDEYTALSELLRNLEDHPLVAGRNLSIDYSDLRQLGWRLSELIPLGIDIRQELLELNDPVERLSKIEKLVSEMANNS
ncbi:MAG: peptidase S16 [Gammaproteobacteria bacterium]|nr:peptidase S16 [Gammaproteobacteria bacterium]